jgi:hypothetical protein
MSNKHLACLILSAFMVGCVQLGLIMHKKMTAAREEQEVAETAQRFAEDNRRLKEIQLSRLKQETAPLRRFLALWLPKLEETNDETKSRAIFNRLVKIHGEGLVSHADRSNALGNKGKVFIPSRFQNIIAVEGDYITAVGLIGQIEKEMPASRITTLNVAKGTRGSDVRLSMTVETPIIAKAADPAAKK